ncbi:hypothetical protein ACOME3_005388 [Neoechinorhynchus agilis]
MVTDSNPLTLAGIWCISPLDHLDTTTGIPPNSQIPPGEVGLITGIWCISPLDHLDTTTGIPPNSQIPPGGGSVSFLPSTRHFVSFGCASSMVTDSNPLSLAGIWCISPLDHLDTTTGIPPNSQIPPGGGSVSFLPSTRHFVSFGCASSMVTDSNPLTLAGIWCISPLDHLDTTTGIPPNSQIPPGEVGLISEFPPFNEAFRLFWLCVIYGNGFEPVEPSGNLVH